MAETDEGRSERKAEDGAGCICGAAVAGRPEHPEPTNKASPSHPSTMMEKISFVRVFAVDVRSTTALSPLK